MPYINTVHCDEIQCGDIPNIPISTVEIGQSIDPTKPFSMQNIGIFNDIGILQQVGTQFNFGLLQAFGLTSKYGFQLNVGGQATAQPSYEGATVYTNLASPIGNLEGPWTKNGSSIDTSGPSDIRAKTNICNLDNSLDKVLSLRGVSFDWNKEIVPEKYEEQKHAIGLIAQEVEQIIPEIVNIKTIEHKELKTIEYDKLTAVLVEAIKEQQKQIEELKETVQKLSTPYPKSDGVCYDV